CARQNLESSSYDHW
nr:immunoglobulin heavy chain junction region [Macaca mulatta]MOX95483.1 immunoglobulin heavy chain junction region [Macaca mulatta]MOX96257.1 immunoglobulin heavy chain junction region [Macaca mulatta]